MEQWVRRKINPGSDRRVQQLAWQISRKRARRGARASKIFTKAFRRLRGTFRRIQKAAMRRALKRISGRA